MDRLHFSKEIRKRLPPGVRSAQLCAGARLTKDILFTGSPHCSNTTVPCLLLKKSCVPIVGGFRMHLENLEGRNDLEQMTRIQKTQEMQTQKTADENYCHFRNLSTPPCRKSFHHGARISDTNHSKNRRQQRKTTVPHIESPCFHENVCAHFVRGDYQLDHASSLSEKPV